MTNINELRDLFIQYKIEYASIDSCINWAEERLANKEEADDQDIIQLAGTTKWEDAEKLVVKILEKYLGSNEINYEFYFGKYIAKLYDMYGDEKYTIDELEVILNNIFVELGYPFWLQRLSNNCELSTDIIDYVEPFEKEFEYIAGLWRSVNSLDEFNQKYDYEISESHDAKMKTIPIFYYDKYYNVIWFLIIIAIILGITLIKEFFYK